MPGPPFASWNRALFLIDVPAGTSPVTTPILTRRPLNRDGSANVLLLLNTFMDVWKKLCTL